MATATHSQTRPPSYRPKRARVTVYLDTPLAEWGKQQQGGLSDLLRRLLEAAHNDESTPLSLPPATYPAELLAQYRTLADKKLTTGLTPLEENSWHALRAAINAADRNSPSLQEREQAAQQIDNEYDRLRRYIETLPGRGAGE